MMRREPYEGADFPCDRSVLTIRRFLGSVAARARAQQDGEKASEAQRVGAEFARPPRVWEAFVPTTILLSPPIEGQSVITEDVDGTHSPGFTTGIKVVDQVRHYPSARLQQVAVRTYLTLPARHCEVRNRATYLASSGYPLRADAASFGSSPDVFGGLTLREHRRLHFITDDEKVALAAVLVARSDPVVAFSADSTWPRHPLVREVAARLGCVILRLPLADIPWPVRRRIRWVRYVPVEESS